MAPGKDIYCKICIKLVNKNTERKFGFKYSFGKEISQAGNLYKKKVDINILMKSK